MYISLEYSEYCKIFVAGTHWMNFYLFMISDVLAYILITSNYWYNSTSSTSIRYKSVKVMSGARNVYWRVLVIIHIFNFISTLYNYISSKVISSSFNGFWISSFVKFIRCVYISYVWKKGLHFLNRITHIYLCILFLLLFILKSYAIKYNSQLFFLLFTIFSILIQYIKYFKLFPLSNLFYRYL